MPATAMSQEAIYSTLYAVLALTDSIFQIWITLTFAVLVATYVAERHFDRGMYRLVSGLYAFASAILFVRFGSAAYQAFHYKNLLIARGFEPWPVPNIVSLVIGVGTLLFLFAGSSARFGLCAVHGSEAALLNEPKPSQSLEASAGRRDD
jgi:hypothetical protein